MQNTGEEIEQLEYVLNEMEHIADVNRAPRVIPNARVEEVFAYLCRVFEFLQHRLKPVSYTHLKNWLQVEGCYKDALLLQCLNPKK